MKKQFIRILSIVTLVLCLFISGATVLAQTPYPTYNYNVYGESVPVPPIYNVSQVIDGTLLDIGEFKNASDLYITESGDIYILDSGNNRIVILDNEYRVKNIISRFYYNKDNEELELNINNGAGIYIDKNDNTIWMAMGEDEIVIQIDNTGKILTSLSKPVGENVPSDMFFKPVKVVVGDDSIVYIVSEGVFQGIITMDMDGKFLGFFGSNRVDITLSVITEVLWKKFFSAFSQTAVDHMQKIVPIEYSSIDVNKHGFIYAVTAQSENSMYEIKKLDPKGNNIMRVKPANDVPPGVQLNIGNYGDIEHSYDKGIKIDTKFIDVTVDENGFVNALDVQRGRIFQYDAESNLIGIFGGNGQSVGTFIKPVAVESHGSQVFVLDMGSSEIVIFKPTEFGNTIRNATLLFNDGLYSQSEELWQEVLKQSTNYELAYVGIGMAMFSRHEYAQAMKYAKLGYDKKIYDEAYTQLRKDILRNNFLYFLLGIIGVLILWRLLKTIFKKYKIMNKIFGDKDYLSFTYYIFHPFKAADEIKIEEKGVVWHAIAVIVGIYITRVLSLGLTGFLFNNIRLELIDITREFFIIFGLYGIFIISNWAVCTLIDGEGRWKDIIIIGGYSFIPIVVGNLINLILSNVLTLREGTFMALISSIALYWSLFLLFIGLMSIHRYTVGKAIWSGMLTVIGILFIVFLGVLVYSLFSQMMVFAGNIITEIMFRV